MARLDSWVIAPNIDKCGEVSNVDDLVERKEIPNQRFEVQPLVGGVLQCTVVQIQAVDVDAGAFRLHLLKVRIGCRALPQAPVRPLIDCASGTPPLF